jgi:integrase
MKLRRLSDGRFYRNIGYLVSGQQPKFMLGRDEAEATLRAAMLEKLWAVACELAREMGDDPAWDRNLLPVAKAVAQGQTAVQVDPCDDDILATQWAAAMQAELPFLQLRLRDRAKEQSGQAYWREEGRKLIERGRSYLRREGNQRMHEAMDAYAAWVREEYRLPSGHVSDWGAKKVDQLTFCKGALPDVRLADLDAAKIEELLGVLAKRPVSRKTGLPIARRYASMVVKEFRCFLRWLNKSKDWEWVRPHDYDVTPVRVRQFPEEVANAGALSVKTFELEELATLWRYATPWERVLMALALNCGFGMGEIATLRRRDIFLHEPHPYARQIGLEPLEDESWVRRVRQKTAVYAEWRLWPVTVCAVEWMAGNRSHPEFLVVTKAGKPLKVSGRRNVQIANAWTRLHQRVCKDHPGFRRLSFNKLRKTAINFVRLDAGEEVAALFAAHGKEVTDDLLKHYSNRRWGALHAAIWNIRAKYAVVFDAVAEPFPPGEVKGGANISVATIDEIIRRRKGGERISAIAEAMNLSRETVRRRVGRSGERAAGLQDRG